MDLKSNERVVSGHPYEDATIVPLGTSYWASNDCNSQDLQLSKSIDNFSLLTACIAPPNAVRADQQGGGCQVSTSSISSSP